MAEPVFLTPNAKQIDEWNGGTGRRWLERHELADRQIAPFGRRAMERAAIRPGNRVLDIGCGCGETALEIGRRVGDRGRVLGVDISRLLIDAARQLSQEAKASNLRFEVADAQTYPFAPRSFDVVFSRFGIMFFDDPEAAFRNLRSALAPGGRIAFVCWPEPQENLFVTIPMAAASRHITLPARGEPGAPGPFAFADPSRVRGMLSRSGFADIESLKLVEKVGKGSRDETAEMLLQLGPLADLVNELDIQTREAIAAAIRSELAQFEAEGRVQFDAVAWLVTARSA